MTHISRDVLAKRAAACALRNGALRRYVTEDTKAMENAYIELSKVTPVVGNLSQRSAWIMPAVKGESDQVRSENLQKILAVLDAPMSSKDICVKTGLTRYAVRHALHSAIENGDLEADRGNARRYLYSKPVDRNKT